MINVQKYDKWWKIWSIAESAENPLYLRSDWELLKWTKPENMIKWQKYDNWAKIWRNCKNMMGAPKIWWIA